jgi:hypothetical protein
MAAKATSTPPAGAIGTVVVIVCAATGVAVSVGTTVAAVSLGTSVAASSVLPMSGRGVGVAFAVGSQSYGQMNTSTYLILMRTILHQPEMSAHRTTPAAAKPGRQQTK